MTVTDTVTESAPAPTPQRRRWLIIFGILLALVYLTSIGLYAEAGRARTSESVPVVEDGVNFVLDLVSVDTARQQIVIRTIIVPKGSFEGPNSTFAKTLRITARLQAGQATVREIPAGTVIGGATEYSFFVDGNPSTYPFDTYTFAVPDDAAADPYDSPLLPAPLFTVEEVGPDGKVLPTSIPLGVGSPNPLSGWTEDWDFSSGDNTLMLYLTIKRAGGVLAFVLVVLTLMLIVGVLASLVARAVSSRRKPIEATMAGWFAALLFALVPLRTNLPGSPPIGAWIDVVVFFWVEIALLVAMSVFIGSWLRYRKPPE